jgi:DNA-binding Lrp family transcriptional regulator
MTHKPPALDSFDLKILQRHQHDTRLPADAIGAEVGLSAAAVQRRLKRLREGGVIEAEVAQIEPAAVGLPLTCIVGVKLEREANAEVERFKARMLASATVQQCYKVTGEPDFILVVVAPDMARYEAFTREALLADPNVRSFTTYVVLDRVKAGVGLPIDPAAAG